MFEKKGKFGHIQRISEQFTNFHANSYNSTDDVAIFEQKENNTLFSSKHFLDNIHFDLTYFPLKHLGYKFVVMTITDILAMNAIPTHLTIELSVSNRFSIDLIDEIMEGVRLCCQQYKIDLLKFDIGSSQQGLVATVTAVGNVSPHKMVTRKGAKENDLVCVTGDLGAAYAGLLLLEREKKVFEVNPQMQPNFDGLDYLLERQLKPEPPFEIIENFKKIDLLPTSMIVVANGLAPAMLHICQASHVGCQLIEGKLPIDIVTFQTLKDFNIVATTAALNGGEDYELLFTISQTDIEKVRTIKDVSIIGYIKENESGYHLITNDDKQIPLTAQEFTDFTI